MLQLRKIQTRHSLPPGELRRLRNTFKRRHCVLLRGFLAPDVLRRVQQGFKKAAFYDREHKGIALESCMRPHKMTAFLNFLINDPEVFRAVEKITGCRRIGCFSGRVYQYVAGAKYYDSWHGDLVKGRLLGVSVNVGRRPYAGGFLQIKNKKSGKLLSQTKNRRPGDAMIFRIHPDLRHRVTPVTGKAPRRVYAGWFRSNPSFMRMIKTKETFVI